MTQVGIVMGSDSDMPVMAKAADILEELGIEPNESFVLTENVPYKDALTVAAFIRYLKNAEIVRDDGFDIDEYIL